MILGLSFSHNATAAVIDPNNGQVVFCSSEERFSRKKNDWGIPWKTLDYIFTNLFSVEDITQIVVGELCNSKFGAEKFVDLMYLNNLDYKDSVVSSKARFLALLIKETLARIIKPKNSYRHIVETRLREYGLHSNVSFESHHDCHAASALYCSGFETCTIITLDGEGDGSSGGVWTCTDEWTLVRRQLFPQEWSFGKFYRMITSALGFTVNRHEGKITGLAAYGDEKRFFNDLSKCLVVDGKDGKLKIDNKFAASHLAKFSLRDVKIFSFLSFAYKLLTVKGGWEETLNSLIRVNARKTLYGSIRITNTEAFRDMADIASAAQAVLEDRVIKIVNNVSAAYDCTNLALAGGVFANVKLNQRILDACEVKEVYIHPGMGDEGLAIGAAKLRLSKNSSKRAQKFLDSLYLGAEIVESDVVSELKNYRYRYEKLTVEQLAEKTANALRDEKIVGVCRGRSEYGPRALGHRTIMINPSKKEINDTVNRRLNRTEFMPFAPAVLEEKFEDIFINAKISGAKTACKFMTITLDVKPEIAAEIPGVVHIDGTARPQVVSQETDEFYFRSLEKFEEKTGISCVVNTSFNMHEEPIINSPADALRAFSTGCVDFMVLGDFWVEYRKQEEPR